MDILAIIPTDILAIIAAVLAALTAALASFKLFFGDFDGFLECLRFWFTPDIISLFRGEYWDDWWGEAKLGWWIALSTGCGFLAYFGVMRLGG